MTLPQLVASDLDGTLLGHDGAVSRRTANALRQTARRGVAVVAATGRSHRTAVPLIEPVGAVGWAVCSNGALVLDTTSGEVIASRPIGAALVDEALGSLRLNLPGITVAWESLDGFGAEGAFIELRPDRRAIWEARRLGPPEPRDGVLKLMFDHPDASHHDLLAALRPHLPGELTAAASTAPFVEVTGAGVDKASGLSLLCDRLGIEPAAVVAFGDNDNDAAMLRWAGRGVAMAHAHPSALAVADLVAPAGPDGVAVVLEELLGFPA
jgi:Cof subfamily protein (haloacid dehalogenase superfamily)